MGVYKRGDVWWIRYTRAGKSYFESSGSKRKQDAVDLLRRHHGDITRGVPITPKIGKFTFDEAAEDLILDFQTNDKASLEVVQRRITKHLTPFFGGRKMIAITTSHVRAYIAQRQTEPSVLVKQAYTDEATGERIAEERRPASSASINRELALLKRMFVLAIQSGKLLHRPHIPMLREDNVRTGFFEPEQLAAVVKHLPAAIQPVIEFAALTGWRIASEVLPLEWRQVDVAAGEIRLDAGTTKNRQGRVFPMTRDLRVLMERQKAEHERLKHAGFIMPNVFFRMVAKGRGGELEPKPIVAFTKAWNTACRKAGCPGRLPHDLRRTAIRTFVRNGIPERVAMKLTGHLTPSVFARYDIVSGSDLQDAAARLDATARIRA